MVIPINEGSKILHEFNRGIEIQTGFCSNPAIGLCYGNGSESR
jgi:hypothetical protein